MSNPVSNENSYESIVEILRTVLTEGIHSVLLGQVLTVIDSSITDKQQNKAVKDLIKQRFHDTGIGVMERMKEVIYRVAKQEGQEIKNDQDENFVIK